MRQHQLIIWITALAACMASPCESRGEAVEACPILKVSISEIPASYRLRFHPSVFSSSRKPMKADDVNPIKPEEGIDMAVLWQNKTSQPLRDLVVRFEYQQAKTSAFSVIEQTVREAAPGEHWAKFRLRGGEFEDTLHIVAWRVTVVSAGQMLGEKKSSMWR